MIEMPETGINHSVKKHNCDLITVADWVIASALFCQENVSKSDVADVLLENQVYVDQDFCLEFIDSTWNYLKIFFNHYPSPSLSFETRVIKSVSQWESDLALAYCLTASLRGSYPKWSQKHCGDYLEQGRILEQLTVISLSKLHPEAQFRSTGWSGINDNPTFGALVSEICKQTNFTEQNLALWDNGKTKDLGLDVYGYLPGHGRRPGTHFMMYQCASGENWTQKRKTPDTEIWKHIIECYTPPIRGMAIPFFVEEHIFLQSLIILEGPLLDRIGLLSGIDQTQMPAELRTSIEKWVSMRIKNLKYYD